MINIFMDDMRPSPEGFILVKNASECRLVTRYNKIKTMSLDHDLGEKETGYDFCKWLVEVGIEDPSIYPEEIYLHTANGVGRDNMYQLLMRYKPNYVKVHRSPIPFE